MSCTDIPRHHTDNQTNDGAAHTKEERANLLARVYAHTCLSLIVNANELS